MNNWNKKRKKGGEREKWRGGHRKDTRSYSGRRSAVDIRKERKTKSLGSKVKRTPTRHRHAYMTHEV
jgi:hypothetical protein